MDNQGFQDFNDFYISGFMIRKSFRFHGKIDNKGLGLDNMLSV